MDRYLSIELDSFGLHISGAQGYASISWILMGIVLVSVVGYRIVKRIRKGK